MHETLRQGETTIHGNRSIQSRTWSWPTTKQREGMSCLQGEALDNNILRPIAFAFASISLAAIERKYSNKERETLGM